MSVGRMASGGIAGACALLLLGAGSLAGQVVEDRFPGVNLSLTYETRTQPALAVQPFTAGLGGEAATSRVQAIIARDLRYSNRFQVMDSLPAAFVRDEVDYALWDQVGATWLVTGRVEGSGGGFSLLLEVHDVVYREVLERGRFQVPDPSSPEFRLAVHAASDEIVRWVFGEPGIAATRIVFSRRTDEGAQELWSIDSDGENLHRLTNNRSTSLSAAWSPDGTRIAYTSYHGESGMPRVFELNLNTGQNRALPAPRTGDYVTPTYHPNGEILAFGVLGGGRSGLYTYNTARDCCFTALFEGRSDDLSPTYSPDGTRIAFNSNRLAVSAPQIYVMNADGSSPQVVSPYLFRSPGYYTSPDWSPIGDRLAYHGRVETRGRHQILVSELSQRNRLVQLTFEGNNEDPSWAPDGRHIVFVGERSWGRGLFIVDAVTGTTRTLVSGIRPNLPSWSPSLAPRVADDR